MKKVIFVFTEGFDPRKSLAVKFGREIIKTFSGKDWILNSDLFLEQMLSALDHLDNILVFYCGSNFELLSYWENFQKLDVSLLIDKFIEIAGGHDTEEKKAIVKDLFFLGVNAVLFKKQGIGRISILNKLVEAVGGRDTEEQKKMAKDLFFGGVPRLLQV
jgi:hypothetical protein